MHLMNQSRRLLSSKKTSNRVIQEGRKAQSIADSHTYPSNLELNFAFSKVYPAIHRNRAAFDAAIKNYIISE